MEWWIFLSITVFIIIDAIGAYLMRNAAVLKGYGDDYHIFAYCFWLGLFGYLYVISLPDLVSQSQNQQIIDILKGDKNE